MSEKNADGKTSWVQYAITTVIAIGWSVFDRWARLEPLLEPLMPLVSPIAYMAIGAALGSLVYRSLVKKKLSAKDVEISELKNRPTREELNDAVGAARMEAVDRLEEMRQRAESAEATIKKIETAGQLDQFGKAQLLAMADIADAMDSGGVYETSSGDSICSTLQHLRVVSYVSGGKKYHSRWVLVPEWLKVVRRRRSEIDERTKTLREEREMKAAEQRRRREEASSRPSIYPSVSCGAVLTTGGSPAGGPSSNDAQSARDVVASNLSAGLSAAAGGVDGIMRSSAKAGDVKIPGLSPIEAEMVRSIWNEGSLRVGTRWISVARVLKSRGIIYRLDAPDSDVIEQCDVTLTDEWRKRVMEMAEREL